MKDHFTMKLHTLFVFCLAALVAADPVRFTPKTSPAPGPVTTILYESDGQTDFIIAEGYDTRSLSYMYGVFDITTFSASDNRSSMAQDLEILALKGNAKEKKLSFAVEAWPFNEGDREDDSFCMSKSDPGLKNLIDGCQSRIVLRGLREQERKQLQEFKEEQKKINEPFFKVVHLEKQIKLKSSGFMIDFAIQDKWQFDEGINEAFLVGLIHENSDGSDPWNYRFALANENLFDRSFVVETIPKGSQVDCYTTDPVDLRPAECIGLRLRQSNKDDY